MHNFWQHGKVAHYYADFAKVRITISEMKNSIANVSSSSVHKAHTYSVGGSKIILVQPCIFLLLVQIYLT